MTSNVHPQAIQDVYEFVSSSDLEKCSIASLAHQWMLCSEWVPSEWVQTADKNITLSAIWALILTIILIAWGYPWGFGMNY